MLKRSSALASVALIAVSVGLAAPAWAESLQDAIALAYRTNPTLMAQRANQRALDETVPQARAGLRPSLNVSVGANYSNIDDKRLGNTETDTGNASIGLSQTLYSGGRVGHGIGAAEANVLSGRENLRSVEQQVLASVITAYVDVQRDMEILQIRQQNLTVLRRQLDESNARFEVGEITRTDVAQSESRLATSQSDLAAAQAQLSVSRAAYAAVVGQSPTNLVTPPNLPGVPTDFDVALDTGLKSNPGILAAEYGLRAAESTVAQARAGYRPSAQLTASYGGSDDLSSFDLTQRTAFQAGATLTVPLFTGGLTQSRVAQALEQANAAQYAIEGQRRTVLQNVSSAYAQLLSTRASLTSGSEAVRAATVAAEGVRQEAQVGLRTTLDVLNQELELRSAQVLLVSARRNEYVAQAQLLAAMGRLEGPDLNPSIETYDATANYDRVRGRGSLPWDGVVESLDRVGAPVITTTPAAVAAPIDQQLTSGVIRTAPSGN